MNKVIKTVVFLSTIQAGVAATNYIGDAAAEGISVTTQGGTAADTLASLTYILHTDVSLYTAPTNQTITLTEVNYFSQGTANLVPFVARYTAGNSQTAGDYEILSIGDSLTASSGLNNQAFTVSGSNPTINLNAGDVLAAGWHQDGRAVIHAPVTSGVADYVAQTNTISSIGSAPTADSGFAFDRRLAFNIGFEAVPEPSGVALLGLGIIGGLFRRRRL